MSDLCDVFIFKRTAKTCFVLRLTTPALHALRMLREEGEDFSKAVHYVVSVVPGCSLSIKNKSRDAAAKEYAEKYGATAERVRGKDYFGGGKG